MRDILGLITSYFSLLVFCLNSINILLCIYFFILFFLLLVTRLVSRVLESAGIRQLSQFSVVIKRNRQYDAAGLQVRDVVIQRRLSVSSVQQPPNSRQARRLSVAAIPINGILGQQPTTIVNNGASSSLISNSQSNDVQMANAGIPSDLPSANVPHQSNDQQSSAVNDDANSSLIEDVQMANTSVPFDSPSANVSRQSNDQESLAVNDDAGAAVVDVGQTDNGEPMNKRPEIIPTNKTAFPGHVQKKGRLSYFNRSDMDLYVSKFQPTQAAPAPRIRRRHSMIESRPPLSRLNRFSLDTIPELSPETSSENNANAMNTIRATNGPEQQEPIFKKIRWELPKLIPISCFAPEDILRAKKSNEGE